METIIRFYNQNRIMFWLIVIVIVLLLLVIHFLNSLVVSSKENNINNTIINERLYENKVDINEQITKQQVTETKDLIIDQFIKYCNSNNIENAYNLLSTECKKEIFPTIQEFQENYIRVNFNNQKYYSKELYNGNTYKVILHENMLSTGNVKQISNEDYYTIIQEDNEYKLNISNYIGKEQINRTNEYESLKVEVINKNTYKEYEIYELKVTNLTYNTILLDTKQKTTTMYLEDTQNVKHYSVSHEVLDNSLLIKPNATNTIFIKYIKEYGLSTSRKIVFNDAIFNYMEGTENQRVKLEIAI